MEQFIVSARKYRPQTFKDVVGQQSITNTLENAIKNNHLAQALLFTGPRGVGKTTCARILARKINQQGYDDPNEDFTFNVFELDAASNNSVENIRQLIDQVRIPPQTGKYKVYIIDEVHMLSSAAFNAFLKTLEEPPKHVIFILATTEKHKIIPTILSRCQIFDFKRITVADAANHLAEVAKSQGITCEPGSLEIIAQKADGAMRDALSIFDRVVSFCGNHLTRKDVAENLNVLDFEVYIELTDLMVENNIPVLLLKLDEILAKGFDGNHLINGMATHFRNLLVVKTPNTVDLLYITDEGKKVFETQAQKLSYTQLIEMIDIANACDLKYKSSNNQRLLVELALMQLGSITHPDAEKKKKAEFFIISSNYFKQKDALEVSDNSHNQQVHEEVENVNKVNKIEANTLVYSLKSIENKRVAEEKIQHIFHQNVKENKTFTDEMFHNVWLKIIDEYKKKNRRLLASNMELAEKRATEAPFVYKLTFPSEGSKYIFEEEKLNILSRLRVELQNFEINFEIDVNEKVEVKQVYQSFEDKFEEMKTTYPFLQKMIETFQLKIKQ